ncbi:hypothetical protein QE152_g27292 [Popillia japonica]|uniref:Reverse transcriptase domain-containing protein n=1 Tax=Popillia japonica TaxID=7064 RepID=A0AAW1JV98_POPJA
MFSDDLKLFREVSSLEDCEFLQADLERVSQCEDNNIALNARKGKMITFTRVSAPIIFNYSLREAILERVELIKDLGELFDAGLTFAQHSLREAILERVELIKDLGELFDAGLTFVQLKRSHPGAC